jgi:hypothetical protein
MRGFIRETRGYYFVDSAFLFLRAAAATPRPPASPRPRVPGSGTAEVTFWNTIAPSDQNQPIPFPLIASTDIIVAEKLSLSA